MSLIKAEIWLGSHPLFLWTDIINYNSFHRGSGFAYKHTTSVCTESLMICLHQITSAYWSLYRSLFPPLCADICMYIQHCNHRSSLFRVASGGPAAAHVWRGCCGFWTLSRKGPKLGIIVPMRQKDVVMMSPLAWVVQKTYPQNTGDTWLKLTYNRFPLGFVIGLCNMQLYCFRTG